MSLKQVIDQDLKEALLAGDRLKADTLRMIKSVILNQEIAQNKRDSGLDDQEVIACLQKEAKKRQEASDLYIKAGSVERSKKELDEKKVIEAYLPEMMSDSELIELTRNIISKHGSASIQDMGVIIKSVKESSDGRADGARIASIVKDQLSSK
ncbi:MAG: GatB/YqeY domain-containing protein [Candidatus Nomurabacteria bacterium]|nr:GatB/YqeY domain-containing protein [Candidatus Saccharibacteria bacterium]USN95695.1 MAG: GatB/YqeY domain-containing protein [Candidatus Nomurabacteria bacterium]